MACTLTCCSERSHHSSYTVCVCVCFSEEVPGWEVDIQHDVIEECNKHGGVVHIYVDRNSAEVHEPGPEHCRQNLNTDVTLIC